MIAFHPITHISEYLLVKVDSTREPYWEKYYKNDKYLFLNQVLATSDGGCLMNGVSYDKEKAIEEELDIYIIKVNNDGDDPTTIKEAKQKIILKFIPTRSIILLPLFQKKLLHLFFNFTIIPEQ